MNNMPVKTENEDYSVVKTKNEDYSMVKNDAVYMIGETYESLLTAFHCVISVILSPLIATAHLINELADIIEIIAEFASSFWSVTGCYIRIIGYTYITTKNFLISPSSPNYQMLHIMKIYEELKIITDSLHITPFSQRESIALHIFLRKIPQVIWDNILPYPDVFFQDSISNIEPVDDNELVTFVTEGSKSASILKVVPHFKDLN